MDVRGAADDVWASLWRHILPVEAQQMLMDNVPLSYVRALFPMGTAQAPEYVIVQDRLLRLLARKMHAAELTGAFEQVFCGKLREYDLNQTSLSRNRVPWHEVGGRLTDTTILNVMLSYDPDALKAVAPCAGYVGQVLHSLAWWLLCEDATQRHAEPGMLTARYAGMFSSLLNVGDHHHVVS